MYRSRVSLLLLLALSWILPSAAGAAAPAAPAASGDAPACDEISGSGLGQTKRWRILAVGNGLATPVPLVACRRDLPGPAMVRVLGMSKVFDGQGEDSDSPSGGPYVSLREFQDGRALLQTQTFFPQPHSGDSAGSFTVVDLDRGVVTPPIAPFEETLAFDGYVAGFHEIATVMTRQGGLAFAPVTQDPSADRQIGPFTLWDGAGRRTLDAAPADAAASLGSAGEPDGLYVRDVAGTVTRVPLVGPASLADLPDDPALALESIPLKKVKPYEGGFSGTFLDDGSTIFALDPFSSGPLIEYSTSSTDPRATARLVPDLSGEGQSFRLAPRSVRELRVLAGGRGAALVAGRFAAHPKQRRVVLVGATRKATAFFDVPARPAMQRPGRAVIGSPVIALADRNTLRVWSGKRGKTIHVPGVRDLAAPLLGPGLFFRTANNTPTFRKP